MKVALNSEKDIRVFQLSNSHGIEVEILNLGGIIRSIRVPDSLGKKENIVLAYDDLDSYLHDPYYLGAIVGPFANRIASSKVSLLGETVDFEKGLNGHHLHSENAGINRRFWRSDSKCSEYDNQIRLTLDLKDGEGGYPGNRKINAVFNLNEDNLLKIELSATTDKPTIVNLSNHCYFNLSGPDFWNTPFSISDHQLKINANQYLPVDRELIPTGDKNDVDGSPFNFKKLVPIKNLITENNPQLSYADGFDHCFCLDKNSSKKSSAELVDKASGRCMQIYTNQPGLQFYSGNHLGQGCITSTENTNHRQFSKSAGVCLEPQAFPNSPNQPSFTNTVLMPGQTYLNQIALNFSIV